MLHHSWFACVFDFEVTHYSCRTRRSYFLCKLTPVSTAITPCAREIAEAVWMPVDEFLSPAVTLINRVALCVALGRPLPADYPKSPLGDTGVIQEVDMTSVLNPAQTYKVYYAAEAGRL